MKSNNNNNSNSNNNFFYDDNDNNNSRLNLKNFNLACQKVTSFYFFYLHFSRLSIDIKKKMFIQKGTEAIGEEGKAKAEEKRTAMDCNSSGNDDDISDKEEVINALRDRLENHNENRKSVQERFIEICNNMRKRIDSMEEKFNSELQSKFTSEDERLQYAIHLISKAGLLVEKDKAKGEKELADALRKGRAELVVEQSYSIGINEKTGPGEGEEEEEEGNNDGIRGLHPNRGLGYKRDYQYFPPFAVRGDRMEEALGSAFTDAYTLRTNVRILTERLSSKKLSPPSVVGVSSGRIQISVPGFLSKEEERVLSEHNLTKEIKQIVSCKKAYDPDNVKEEEEEERHGGGGHYHLPYPQPRVARKFLHEYEPKKVENGKKNVFEFEPSPFYAETKYLIKVGAKTKEGAWEWSDPTEFVSPELAKCCKWVSERHEIIDKENPMVLKSPGGGNAFGSVPLPLNKITSWSIKFLNYTNNKSSTCVGVAQYSGYINTYRCTGTWHLHCYDMVVNSSISYNCKEYGPRKRDGEYIHTGDSVGVVMDTTKGELSFILGGVNFGVAFSGIPLDKPLVPYVSLGSDVSVMLDFTETKEEVSDAVLIPQSLVVTEIFWDYISLMWEWAEGAVAYQVEMNGSKVANYINSATFTKSGLLPDTEYTFRVRTVGNGGVSNWSDPVIQKTSSVPPLSSCTWKKCPSNFADTYVNYSLDIMKPTVATNVGDGGAVVVLGTSPIPNMINAFWSVNVFSYAEQRGRGVFVGVAPFDAEVDSFMKSRVGWFYNHRSSSLSSGPPQNFINKSYGPKGESNESEYIVSVIMDTTMGELSFIDNGIELGLAFDGIPMDKPLVPSVVLMAQGDSAELII